jgi:hypothetical protein
MLKQIFNNKAFQASIPWIVLIIGLIGYSLGSFIDFENKRIAEYCKGIGTTLLTSGIFAVILKSMQFMGMFKEELVKIIYEPKHLSNRSDLPSLWEKMSTVLFKNKFPKINEKILKDIKDLYFPTSQVSYYDGAEHTLEILIIDKENGIVKIIDNSTLDVICESKDIKSEYVFGYSKDNIDGYKLIKFVIDGDSSPKYQTNTQNINNLDYEISVAKLTGKEKYSIEKTSERMLNLNVDNVVAFNAKKIFNKLKIIIHHDENISIELKKSGTLRGFNLKKERSNYKEYICDGLIYPEQGYYYQIKIK